MSCGFLQWCNVFYGYTPACPIWVKTVMTSHAMLLQCLYYAHAVTYTGHQQLYSHVHEHVFKITTDVTGLSCVTNSTLQLTVSLNII